MTNHCTNCGTETEAGDKFCGVCGSSLRSVEHSTQKIAGRKNPWVAAILNFFFPGIGFVYLSRPVFIVAGLVLIISGIGDTVIYWEYLYEPYTILLSIGFGIGWALAGGLAAEYVNRQEGLG